MSGKIKILTFDNLKETYQFLIDNNAIDKLSLFKNTKITKENRKNTGYVLLDNDEIVGAASIYDEEDGYILNEIFEIIEKFRGKGYARILYEYIKEDSMCDGVHGFCTNDENQSFWEHMGQRCINKKNREMIEKL